MPKENQPSRLVRLFCCPKRGEIMTDVSAILMGYSQKPNKLGFYRIRASHKGLQYASMVSRFLARLDPLRAIELVRQQIEGKYPEFDGSEALWEVAEDIADE
jgi:hypothetical protein